MIIQLSPVRMDEQLSVERHGDLLTINGEACDLGSVLDGATLPASAIASKWFAGDVERIDGELHLALILPHGPNTPESTRFPQPITVTEDGAVPLPAYDAAPESQEATP